MNISDGDPFYQSVIQHLQTILGSAWATYFVPKPPDYAGDTRLVDLEEAMNYIDLLKNFQKMSARTFGKSELCKCAAMHSNIVDRALQCCSFDYNRYVSDYLFQLQLRTSLTLPTQKYWLAWR